MQVNVTEANTNTNNCTSQSAIFLRNKAADGIQHLVRMPRSSRTCASRSGVPTSTPATLTAVRFVRNTDHDFSPSGVWAQFSTTNGFPASDNREAVGPIQWVRTVLFTPPQHQNCCPNSPRKHQQSPADPALRTNSCCGTLRSAGDGTHLAQCQSGHPVPTGTRH